MHHIENGVACGCADPSVDNHMHGPDEFVIIDQLVMSAEIFALAIVNSAEIEKKWKNGRPFNKSLKVWTKLNTFIGY